MNDIDIENLVRELLRLPQETEWVEFKHNNADPIMIAERLSALANSAALKGRDHGFLIWGIEDGSHRIVGTSCKLKESKKGNEPLENWLHQNVRPAVCFDIFECHVDGFAITGIRIGRATHAPVRYNSEEFIRIGSCTKKLREFPQKEAELWATFARTPFEKGIAKSSLSGDEVLAALDFVACFDMLRVTLPSDRKGVLTKMEQERLVVAKGGNRYDITNLGAMLFAKNLNSFDRLGRKAIRIIKYRGNDRVDPEREWRDAPQQRGYALAYQPAIEFISSQLPSNEPIGQAFRTEVRLYPEKAIRELVANALIHQDFNVSGSGPMIELFDQRMEILNPGEPLMDPLRFADHPPRSRNEDLAAMLRRMSVCEEAGTGIDRVLKLVEAYQLPAPEFRASDGYVRSVMSKSKKLSEMNAEERVWACYWHACLCVVSGQKMTNASLRKRLSIEEKNAATASRIIRDASKKSLIKPFDPAMGHRYASYVPFWG